MRRLAAVLAAVAVLAGGCSSGGGDGGNGDGGSAGGTSSSAPSTSAPVSGGGEPPVTCGGLGAAPAAGAAEITFVEAGRLWAVGADGAKRCLLDGVGAEDGVAWGGAADRVLVGNKLALADGKVDQPFTTGGLTVLSRPTGKSVLDVRSGKLNKREVGKDAADITFLQGHEQTIYHPAGTHIVSVGRLDGGGRPTLYIANNRGQAPQDLVQNETARRVYDPAFTASGALLFIADHGDYTEIHRLEIDEGNFTTVERENSPNGMDHLVTSPFEGGGVAWGQGTCDASKGGRRLRAQRSAKYLPTEGTKVERGEPVGWTPDGSLLVMVPGSCAEAGGDSAAPRTLYRFKDGVAAVVAEGVQAAAVRAVLPPPPAPPKVIPQQAPA